MILLAEFFAHLMSLLLKDYQNIDDAIPVII